MIYLLFHRSALHPLASRDLGLFGRIESSQSFFFQEQGLITLCNFDMDLNQVSFGLFWVGLVVH